MSQTGQAGTGCPGIAGMLGSRWLFARVVGRQFRDGVDVDPGDGPAGCQPARQVRRAGQEESGQAVRCTGVLVVGLLNAWAAGCTRKSWILWIQTDQSVVVDGWMQESHIFRVVEDACGVRLNTGRPESGSGAA